MSEQQHAPGPIQQQEQYPFQQARARLQDMQQQLEPLNQRQCSEGKLDLLISTLQSTAHEVRRLSFAPYSWAKAGQTKLLKQLRNASLELLQARDHAARGRTSRFYRHLAVCQEYLEEALLICQQDAPAVSHTLPRFSSASPPSCGDLSLDLQHYCSAILAAQTALVHQQEMLATHDGLSSDRYSALLAALADLNTPVKALCRVLAEACHRLNDPCSPCRQLQIHLYYIDEQICRLLAFIATLETLSYSASRQARRVRLEISLTLDALLRCSDDVPPAVRELLGYLRAARRNVPWLRLVPSPEYPVKGDSDARP